MTKRRKVWMTRTQPGADESAKTLREKGFKPVIAPVLHVSPPRTAPPAPPKKAALIFTSKNGLNFFTQYSDRRDHQVFTVGDATARAAISAGFRDVASAQGTSAELTDLILRAGQKDVPLIHCAGRHVRGSVTQDLQAAGYTARRDLYYITEPIPALPDIDYAALDYVLLYSPLAAQTVARLAPPLHGAKFISISPATDAVLGGLSGERLIAAVPNEAAMLALLLS